MSNPSFFKILVDTTPTHLSFPPDFVQDHLSSETIPEAVVLQTDQLGRKWTVKIEKNGVELCFGEGWLNFVKDTKTEVGDLVAFWMIGKSSFKVSVFGANGCGKNLTSSTLVVPNRVEESKNLCFQKIIQKAQSYNMRFPMKFVKESRIEIHESTMVRNESGREWEVKILKFADGRFGLGSGWLNFRKENKIMEGDTCKLTYLHGDQGSSSGSSSFIQVEVIKKV